jgi:hypothetical protein
VLQKALPEAELKLLQKVPPAVEVLKLPKALKALQKVSLKALQRVL